MRTRSGVVKKIEPWRLTENICKDPIERLYASRPDFNGALIQFLIGLVQTTMPPHDDDDWLYRIHRPPEPDELRNKFNNFSQMFNLEGPGPRFMQDFEQITGKFKSVSSLLIETPGNKTINQNRDHFIKRETVKKVCLCCAATALFTLQTNAPEGGRGHRTSIRGDGPVTTILVDAQETLWKTVSLNTLPENLFMNNVEGDAKLISYADIFPWMAKTRVSDAGQVTRPLDTNPKQVFWGMPRRIRLNISETTPTNCDLCNDVSNKIVENYVTETYGVHYMGTWNHPLTPHRRGKRHIFFPFGLCLGELTIVTG